MIRFHLSCDQGHDFESWFASSETFDRLLSEGAVGCAVCGGSGVTKALMAPAVSHAHGDGLSAPRDPAEAALAALRHEIEAGSDYVGMKFAAEARAMHEGSLPARSIWGEVRPDEARALVEDGVPVAPLPFIPRRNTN